MLLKIKTKSQNMRKIAFLFNSCVLESQLELIKDCINTLVVCEVNE